MKFKQNFLTHNLCKLNLINNYIMMILNFFHKTNNITLWRDIRDNKIIRKKILEFVSKYFVNNC